MSARKHRKIVIDDCPIAVDLDTVRRAAGGRRRLRELTAPVVVALQSGRVVEVALRRRPWCFGGERVFLICPQGHDATVLRAVDEEPWLACKQCLRGVGARYTAQNHWKRVREGVGARRRDGQPAPSPADAASPTGGPP